MVVVLITTLPPSNATVTPLPNCEYIACVPAVVTGVVVAVLVALGAVLTWSRRATWGQMHVLALAGGALLTYAWHAFPQWPVIGSAGQIDFIGNVVFAAGAVALLAAAVSAQRSSAMNAGA